MGGPTENKIPYAARKSRTQVKSTASVPYLHPYLWALVYVTMVIYSPWWTCRYLATPMALVCGDLCSLKRLAHSKVPYDHFYWALTAS